MVDLFSGHSMSIRSIDFSRDNKYLITGCEDHSLRVWDYQTGKAQHLLSGHHDVVSGGAFLNQDTLVSSSWDMTVKIWKIWNKKQVKSAYCCLTISYQRILFYKINNSGYLWWNFGFFKIEIQIFLKIILKLFELNNYYKFKSWNLKFNIRL